MPFMVNSTEISDMCLCLKKRLLTVILDTEITETESEYEPAGHTTEITVIFTETEKRV